MRTENVKVKLRDGVMGAHIAYPNRKPAGAIIAIMEIWGVNDTMRAHAQEHDPEHVKKAFDLYYEFDYDLGVRDLEDTAAFLKKSDLSNGKIGAVGYCLGGKLCYLMRCRTDIDCAVAYYGTYIEHRIKEAQNLHRPFMLHMAVSLMRILWNQAIRISRSSTSKSGLLLPVIPR